MAVTVFDADLLHGTGKVRFRPKLFWGVGCRAGLYRLDQLNEAFLDVLYLERIGHEVTSHDPRRLALPSLCHD
jgi:hypothetical protein